MKLNIPLERENQLKKFVDSKIFSDRSEQSYSEYWREYASLMRLEFHNDGVNVSGVSGFYIPETTFGRFSRVLIKAFKSPRFAVSKILALYRHYFTPPRYMTWAEGFNATMKHAPVTDPDLSPFRINHLDLKINYSEVLANTKEMKQHYEKWTPFSLSDHVIIAYYFRNILTPYINRQKSLNIMEIGGGSGNLASILYRDFSPRVFFMVDLPESIVNAFAFLSSIFPGANFVLPDEFNNFISSFDAENSVTADQGAFVFLTPWQINLLPQDMIDLSINTHSFQEMTHAQINDYFHIIENVSKNESFFFCANRVEKIPCNVNAYTEVQAEPPNRFYEYPWRQKNIRLIDEISRLHRVCSADGTAIRLEKIVKGV